MKKVSIVVSILFILIGSIVSTGFTSQNDKNAIKKELLNLSNEEDLNNEIKNMQKKKSGIVCPKEVKIDESDMGQIENNQKKWYNSSSSSRIQAFKTLYNDKKCNSKLNYNFLKITKNGDKKQKLYNRIKKALEKFYASNINVDGVIDEDGSTYYPFTYINCEDLGLSEEEIQECFFMARQDMPYMYFLYEVLYRTYGDKLVLSTMKEYATYQARKKYYKMIDNKIREYENLTKDCHTIYEKVMLVHDKIIREVSYDFDCMDNDEHYDQNIIGLVDEGIAGTVCYGYSAFNMLVLRYLGIECEFISGYYDLNNNGYVDEDDGGHVWNEIKLDDGKWYGFDLTWCDIDNWDISILNQEFLEDRMGIDYEYFACNKERMQVEHINGFLGDVTKEDLSLYNDYVPQIAENECPYSYDNLIKDMSYVKKDNIEYSTFGPYAMILSYDGDDASITIPSKVDGKTVIAMWKKTFANCKNLKSITFPDTFLAFANSTCSSEGAFYNCPNLESVTLGNYVNYIGQYTFANCNKLFKINVPKKLFNVWYNSVADCNCNMEFVRKAINMGKAGIIKSNGKFTTCPSEIDVNDKVTVVGDNIEKYFSSENRYDFISENGGIDAKKTGRVLVVGKEKKSSGDYDYISQLVKVKGKNNQINDSIKLENFKTSLTYTGNSIEQNVKVYKDDTLLVNNVDYTISYEDNIDAGIAIMIISGKGDYSGETSRTFVIEPKDISDGKITIEGFKKNITYTGKNISQKLKIYKDGIRLKQGKDYYLEYSNRKAVGNVTMNIEGCNNYSGTIIKKFTIVPSVIKKVKLAELTSNSIKLIWTKMLGVNGYIVEKYNEKTKKYVTLKKVKKPTFIDSKLRSMTKYTYRIRAYKNKLKGKVKLVSYLTRPYTPTIKKASNGSSITLKIGKTNKCTGIDIFRKTGKKGKYRLIKTLNKAVKTYIDKAIKKGNNYYYKVRTYKKYNNKKVYSELSKEI